MNGRSCIPDNTELKEEILKEGNQGIFHLHPGRDKIIEELRELFWWKGLRKDVAEFVSRCLICKQVKFEREKSPRLLQPLEISEWKWGPYPWILQLDYQERNEEMTQFG